MRCHGKLGAGRAIAAPQTARRSRRVLLRHDTRAASHASQPSLPETVFRREEFLTETAFRVETDLSHTKQSTAVRSTRNSFHTRRVRAFFALHLPAAPRSQREIEDAKAARLPGRNHRDADIAKGGRYEVRIKT